MSAPIDADFVDETPAGTALAVQGEAAQLAPSGMFGTDDPVDVIARASRVADALKAVVVQKKLVSNIQGKEYPLVEAWTTLAAMLGIAVVTEWTRPVEGGGWEARVVAQRNGLTIGAAEAQCTRDERTWAKRDDYALRSMAQTRATSKALRLPLGFVMTLAGYSATPAEEMPTERSRDRNDNPAPPLDRAKYQPRIFAKMKELADLDARYTNLTNDAGRHEALVKTYGLDAFKDGKPSFTTMSDDDLRDWERRVDSLTAKAKKGAV